MRLSLPSILRELLLEKVSGLVCQILLHFIHMQTDDTWKIR